MSSTKKLTSRITIDADNELVFKKLTTWELQEKWIFATKARGVDSDSKKLGGKLEAFTGIGKFGFLDTMTITKWDPPKLCEVTHTGKVVKGSGIFEVTKINDKSIFTWTEYTEIPFGFFGEIGWLVIGPATKLGMKLSLSRFKKLFNEQS